MDLSHTRVQVPRFAIGVGQTLCEAVKGLLSSPLLPTRDCSSRGLHTTIDNRARARGHPQIFVYLSGGMASLAPSLAVMPLNHDTFISKLSHQTVGLLPVSTIRKWCTKTLQPSETPWCSRRLAGAVAEFQPADQARRSKKKVMRSLEIIGE